MTSSGQRLCPSTLDAGRRCPAVAEGVVYPCPPEKHRPACTATTYASLDSGLTAPYSGSDEHDFPPFAVSLDIPEGIPPPQGFFGHQTPCRIGTLSLHSFITQGCTRRGGSVVQLGQSCRVYGSMILSPRLSGNTSLGAARDRQANSAFSGHRLRCRWIPAPNGGRLASKCPLSFVGRSRGSHRRFISWGRSQGPQSV